jgi:uncharacterized protein YceK
MKLWLPILQWPILGVVLVLTGCASVMERTLFLFKGRPALYESAAEEAVVDEEGGVGKDYVMLPHLVVAGESLLSIAAHYNVSIAQLQDVNDLRDAKISVGQTLKIPVERQR